MQSSVTVTLSVRKHTYITSRLSPMEVSRLRNANDYVLLHTSFASLRVISLKDNNNNLNPASCSYIYKCLFFQHQVRQCNVQKSTNVFFKNPTHVMSILLYYRKRSFNLSPVYLELPSIP